ncbi:MAG: hemolysin III family protein [Lysobacteraceae bacterium]
MTTTTTNQTHVQPVDPEEWANLLTHAIGLVASLIGGTVLIWLTVRGGDGWNIAAAIVYSLSMLLLYIASTAYHGVRHPVAKARLKIFDHCAIYVLIAGTYTPVTLIGLRGPTGWILFAAVWTLALLGIVFKLFFTGRFKRTSTLLYVAMGWLVLFALKPVIQALSTAALAWLIAGGVFYTLGTVFYLSKRIRYSHAIWHVFVLLGSISHFVSVALQVLQLPSS